MLPDDRLIRLVSMLRLTAKKRRLSGRRFEVPKGDAQRVWFLEMIQKLGREWREDLSYPAMIELRDELDDMLQRIRSEKNIRPPLMWCPQCGKETRSAEPHVSVRAMILSLHRFHIASEEQTKNVEKGWAKYRKLEGLDLYGKKSVSAMTEHDCRPV